MPIQEKAEILKAGFVSENERLDGFREQNNQKIALVDAIVIDAEAEAAEREKAAEERGYEEALKDAGQAGGSDKIYSDAQVNEFLQPYKDENEALKTENSSLKADLDTRTLERDAAASELEQLKAAQSEQADAVAKAVAAERADFYQKLVDVSIDNERLAGEYAPQPEVNA